MASPRLRRQVQHGTLDAVVFRKELLLTPAATTREIGISAARSCEESFRFQAQSDECCALRQTLEADTLLAMAPVRPSRAHRLEARPESHSFAASGPSVNDNGWF